MADEAQRSAQTPAWVATLRARLAARGPMLLVTGAVLLVLAIANRLAVGDLVLSIVAIGLLALLLPYSGEAAGTGGAAAGASASGVDEAVRNFADALPEACILLDERGVVRHCNAAASRQFPSVAIGSPLAFSLRFPKLLTAVEAAQAGTAQTIELHQTVPNETWYRVSIAPMAQAAGAGVGLLAMTMQSLTEEKRLEALRSDFIANASHELRTPLTSLVGFIDTLLGPAANDAEARTKFLTLMRAQAARMSKLIDDLLSLSRIEMRQHLRPTAEVELNSLVREVAEALANLARQSGVALNVTVPDEPLVITGDRDELYEVIENLVENALKYGADGGHPVELVLAPAAGRQGFAAAITVTDHGAGVAAEHVPRLTERFYRVDAESSRRKKGTGLGLAIVKHIVNRHQGQLSIRSQPGQGTRVEVLLKR